LTKQDFYRELETMLDLPAGMITGEEALDDLQGWDSMSMLSFIVLADSKLGVVVSAATLSAAKTVQDLVAMFPGKIT
jgi:acyl carrier protein